MITGPEAMPVFNDGTSRRARSATSSRSSPTTRAQPNPGGLSLGRVGPVTEGLVVWIGGIGALVIAGPVDHGKAA